MARKSHGATVVRRIGTPIKVITAATLVVAVAVPAWLLRDQLGIGPTKTTALANESRVTAPAPTPSRSHAGQHNNGGQNNAGQNGNESSQGAGSTAANSGPVTDLDRQLLVKVRQANLWELQAGRLAQENGRSEAVKRAGLHLLDGHSRLDQIVKEISKELEVAIPDEPTADQQEWVRKLRSLKGEEFDRFFANILRSAHGKVFVVVAQVRSTTQNSVIRDLAIEANTAVSDHLEVLEDTGLVEGATLDEVRKAVVK